MKSVMSGLTIFAALAAAGTIEFCSDTACGSSCSDQSTSGLACRALGGIKSTQATQLDDGCSFTIYTDASCSDNGVAVPLNSCIINNNGFGSYSYDC
ncbi:uncharacterized protein APUU_71262A [Aspergillus puulaauensis]|uniref:Uncharacterized protein n=1 Tax=Aspergillus puulaauensis TaxID=1220207 RepID=A0A7R7XXS2_9EURO|nr:uncharacterized protein APUU_71262A [Aspergillus puulaauensis]BCS29692.1 hypothetical protein APUU_71262A [Aspergillus puulaauensis]